ncbi:glutathione S-transferase F13-like [Syzygium oleosum]|uniref:glutathione S-transferase F13-like n=1 Tax=Syzygium oleosum TaxID=219896 RepID=UPI0011D2B44D|nr:glutathione S-transferase F13-like [Syzygium oleosum]
MRHNDFTDLTIVETWMEVEAHQFDSPVRAIVGQMIVNPIHGIAPDEKIIQSETEKLQNVLDVYEERLSKSKYLAGDNYTMADLNHIPYLVYFMRTPKANVISSRPHVNAWWADISSRPAAVKVAEEMNLFIRKVQEHKGVLVP